MKVKVSVPTEPVCTVKLEIDEARALYAHLSGDKFVAHMANKEDVIVALREALREELGLTQEGDLFKDGD